jgi:hypothetical protein
MKTLSLRVRRAKGSRSRGAVQRKGRYSGLSKMRVFIKRNYFNAVEAAGGLLPNHAQRGTRPVKRKKQCQAMNRTAGKRPSVINSPVKESP